MLLYIALYSKNLNPSLHISRRSSVGNAFGLQFRGCWIEPTLLFFNYFLKQSGSIPRNTCFACETAMRDYQESVTTGQTDRQTPDKVIPMCRYVSQATQKDFKVVGWLETSYNVYILRSFNFLVIKRCKCSIKFSKPNFNNTWIICHPIHRRPRYCIVKRSSFFPFIVSLYQTDLWNLCRLRP